MDEIKNKERFWELATAKIHGEASRDEMKELELFLQDHTFQNMYAEIEQLNLDLKKIKPLSHVSQKDSWNQISKTRKQKSLKRLYTISRYAAVFVFALALGGVLSVFLNQQNESESFAEVKVPLGQMSEVTLYDGTKVWLNSGTTLKYSNKFGKDNRDVKVEGEAFFDVQKSDMPFKVQLKSSEVEVLGTQFNVVSYLNDPFSEVTLVEGSVKLNNLTGTTIAQLKPEQQIIIDEKSKKAQIKQVETDFYVSWTEGKIVFNDETLSEISKRLERWYNVEIRLTSTEVEDLHFSGTILKSKPFSQITLAFELLLPINVDYKHIPGDRDLVTISKK